MGCAPSAANIGTKAANEADREAGRPMVNSKDSLNATHRTDPQLSESDSNMKIESKDLLVISSKDGESNSFAGKMKLRTNRMTILLVFGKDDSQSEALKKAADKGGYKVSLFKTSETAMESFTENQQDLVIIDCRHSKHFEYVDLCTSMRAAHPKGHSRFLAVTNKYEKEEPSILHLLKAGFSKRVVECTNIASWYNELITIERGELRTHQQLQACSAMYQALQQISESIEITDAKFRSEFVNSAFERQTGYSANEVIGTEFQDKLQVDNCNEEQTLVYHLRKEQVWEGQQSLRRKNGDVIQCKCKVIPVETSHENVIRYIIIRQAVTADGNPLPHSNWDRLKDMEPRSHERIRAYRRGSYISLTSSEVSYGGLMHIRRKESVAKFHTMTIEAPITRVINMLYDAQASSGAVSVVQALDKVLDILQTTELFAPHIHQVKEEDPLTSDYVGGLCDRTTSNTSSQATRQGFGHKQNTNNNKPGSTFKPQPSTSNSSPEIQKLLESNASWSFDIIKLESLTNKNTLVPLGMKIFERFGAMEHLGVDDKVMANWLQLISINYHSGNPYHNATHASDVLQSTAYFLDKMRPKKILDPQDEIAALIAAVIHDVDHPARSSSFLVNSKNKLALLYNDIAVLENHHAAMGFLLTRRKDESNILKNLDRDAYESLRHKVIDMVLATEMAKHFEHLQKFIHLCTANIKSSSEDGPGGSTGVTSIADHVLDSPENRRQILRMVIKCADVSNPARDTHLMKAWAHRIAEEYFQQTDEEHMLKLPVVMPHFDRATCSIPHSQYKFMEVFLLNMFEHWDAFLDIPEVADQLQTNYKYWKDLEEKDQKRKLSAAGDATSNAAATTQ